MPLTEREKATAIAGNRLTSLTSLSFLVQDNKTCCLHGEIVLKASSPCRMIHYLRKLILPLPISPRLMRHGIIASAKYKFWIRVILKQLKLETRSPCTYVSSIKELVNHQKGRLTLIGSVWQMTRSLEEETSFRLRTQLTPRVAVMQKLFSL